MCRKSWLVPLIGAALMLVGTTSADAAKTVYPRESARNLNAGAAGWIGSSSSEGLCVPVLLCPAISNTVPAAGGAGGSGGYLETSIGSLTGVGATSIGTFRSPAFKYRGVGGRDADSVKLDLVRRSDVDQLLSVAGNEATFGVKLLDVSGGNDVTVITGADLAGADGFTKVPSSEVDPDLLRIGHSYRIEISSRFESGAEVLPGGSAGYDNIALKARSKGGDGHGGPGGPSDPDDHGGVIRKVVKVKGKFVVARVTCAKQAAKRKCKSKLQARLSKRGPKVTSTQRSRVRAGRSDRVRLRIRGKYRNDVRSAKRLTIKRKTRVGGKVATTYTRAKVRG